MPTQFIRIGHQLFNLANVVGVTLNANAQGRECVVISTLMPDGQGTWEPAYYDDDAKKLRAFFETQCNADDPMAGVAHVHVI